MANKYYYLTTVLPCLEFGEIFPITRQAFLDECRKWLIPPDFDRLKRVDADDFEAHPDDPSIVKEWKSFDLALREELAEIRKARKNAVRETKPISYRDIFEGSTPLVMEKKIQKRKWDFIEEKEFGYHFDLNILILYFLKLQILERIAVFEEEKGTAVFEELCGVNYE